MKRISLRPCPHCGGMAILKRTGMLCVLGYQAVCAECGCTGRMVLESTGSLSDTQRTLQQARQAGVDAWNRRV